MIGYGTRRMQDWMYHRLADGYKQALAANVIAENMFASVNEEGHQHLLIDSIVDVRKTRNLLAGKMLLSNLIMVYNVERRQQRAGRY